MKMQPNNPEPLLLTVSEAAALLRIGRNTCYELIARGDLPAIRLGRTIRIPRHRLLAWIENSANDDKDESDARQLTPVATLGAQHH